MTRRLLPPLDLTLLLTPRFPLILSTVLLTILLCCCYFYTWYYCCMNKRKYRPTKYCFIIYYTWHEFKNENMSLSWNVCVSLSVLCILVCLYMFVSVCMGVCLYGICIWVCLCLFRSFELSKNRLADKMKRISNSHNILGCRVE